MYPIMNIQLLHNIFICARFIKPQVAYANELSLDKEQTSHDDSLDALRLSLKGYNIKLII